MACHPVSRTISSTRPSGVVSRVQVWRASDFSIELPNYTPVTVLRGSCGGPVTYVKARQARLEGTRALPCRRRCGESHPPPELRRPLQLVVGRLHEPQPLKDLGRHRRAAARLLAHVERHELVG